MGLGGVLVAMVAATIVFNLFETWQIGAEAEASLDSTIGWEGSSKAPATRATTYFVRNGSGEFADDEEVAYNDLDWLLLGWSMEHPETGVMARVELDEYTCYVEQAELDERPGHDEGTRQLVVYVDVSSQQGLVATVNRVFAGIAIVGGIAAGLAGWFAGRRIEAAEEAQKRFYENMSHELKTPLAAIRGYAEGMETGVVETARGTRAIVRESERMSGLVEQILSLSRLEAGVVVLHREPVEVEDFVQDCLMPFEGIARTRGLDVSLELEPGTIDADPELLGHAVENVLSNAMRHADHEVSVRFDGRALVVENDGVMPDPHDAEHLFDRFYVGKGGGTGIGLALAREIVVQHGWDVRAEVVDGRMRVTITF